MTAVRSIHNQYRGINAHLHSYWQAVGGWSRFHTNHITDIMRTLRPLLLPLGYDADVEPSLQIRRLDDIQPPQYPESDVTIYDLQPDRPRSAHTPPQPASAAELILPIPEALYGEPLSEKEYSAVKVYKVQGSKLDRGTPVAWIELLSPSNKPGGRDADEYFDKRLTILENGIVFIEVDYLHETAPTLKGLPNYRTRRGQMADERGRAYHLIVIDPRPNVRQGWTHVREFDVDAPIPMIDIPLTGEDKLPFDFGVPYRKTFEETLYGQQLVDYSELPQNFDRYSEADRARIVSRMVLILKAVEAKLNLEQAPVEAEAFTLTDGLQQLAALRDRLKS